MKSYTVYVYHDGMEECEYGQVKAPSAKEACLEARTNIQAFLTSHGVEVEVIDDDDKSAIVYAVTVPFKSGYISETVMAADEDEAVEVFCDTVGDNMEYFATDGKDDYFDSTEYRMNMSLLMSDHDEDLTEEVNMHRSFNKFIPLEESSRSPHLLYIESELKSAADALTQLGRDVVISEDNQSMTFETKSGDKITCRVKKAMVPQYQLINDMGDIIYASTSPDKDAIAWEILQEYETH